MNRPQGQGAPDEEQPQVPDLRRSAAERAPARILPAAGIVWTAAEIMHAAAWPSTLETAGAAALAAAVGWGAAGRGKAPSWLPAWLAAAGTWVTAAAAAGPLHWWPYMPLTAAWAAGTGYAYWKASRHPSVTGAREQREARAEWLSWRARHWGLGGSHLVRHERTRLGEAYEADVKGTRKRASQLVTPHLAELVAEDHDLPAVERVRVTMPRPGRIRISIRHENPWDNPVLHPLFDPDSEFDFTVPYSILHAAVTGMDPETGRPLRVPLWDDLGGKVVNIVAMKGSGKTNLLDDLSERVTAAPDALQVRINLSMKGGGEVASWGPSCHLTAFGPDQKNRAVRVLKAVHGVIGWRAQEYGRGEYQPSARDPLIVLITDESDDAAAVPAVRKLLEGAATKGREYGLTWVRAGQRGTADYSSGKARSQDDVFVIGRVNRAGEVYHAAGSAGLQLPDMSSYGEGASGVWAVAEVGGGYELGRAFKFPPAEAARIARERAFTQPELPAACREYLGGDYADLLATDVFAQWARSQDRRPEPVPAAAAAVTDAPPVARRGGGGPGGDFDRWDSELDNPEEDSMDPDARATIAGVNRKLNAASRMAAESAAMEGPPDVPPEVLEAFHAERWRKVGEEAEIPDGDMERFREMLAAGTTISEVMEAFGISRWTARTWLEKLRGKGIAKVVGERRAAKWILTEAGDDDA